MFVGLTIFTVEEPVPEAVEIDRPDGAETAPAPVFEADNSQLLIGQPVVYACVKAVSAKPTEASPWVTNYAEVIEPEAVIVYELPHVTVVVTRGLTCVKPLTIVVLTLKVIV